MSSMSTEYYSYTWTVNGILFIQPGLVRYCPWYAINTAWTWGRHCQGNTIHTAWAGASLSRDCYPYSLVFASKGYLFENIFDLVDTVNERHCQWNAIHTAWTWASLSIENYSYSLDRASLSREYYS